MRVKVMYSYDRRAASVWKAKQITDEDVKTKAQLYWSPRQQAYDPRMMGNSSARTLAPVLFRSFAFDAAVEFYFSRWNQGQAKAVEKAILDSGHPNAQNIARHVGQDMFYNAGGSQQPSVYWDAKYSPRLQSLQSARPQLAEMGMADAASKVGAYLEAVEQIREASEDMIEKSVLSGLKKLGLDPALIGDTER